MSNPSPKSDAGGTHEQADGERPQIRHLRHPHAGVAVEIVLEGVRGVGHPLVDGHGRPELHVLEKLVTFCQLSKKTEGGASLGTW